MLDQIIFLTALIGSIIASIYDLKTTEVPDKVFYAIMIVGIPAVILKAIITGNYNLFFISGITGIGLFAFGYILYKKGQWGGADMVLLGLMGYLIPSIGIGVFGNFVTTLLPIGISFLFNVFMLGAVYMLFYVVIIVLRNKKLLIKCISEIKNSSNIFYSLIISTSILFSGIILYLNYFVNVLNIYEIIKGILLPVFITSFLFLLYKFAKSVEDFGFKRKIPISKLCVGDMLLDEKKIVGITEKQLNKIKNSGRKTIWIKDGIRFIPAFPIAFLFTLYFGDSLFIINYLIG